MLFQCRYCGKSLKTATDVGPECKDKHGYSPRMIQVGLFENERSDEHWRKKEEINVTRAFDKEKHKEYDAFDASELIKTEEPTWTPSDAKDLIIDECKELREGAAEDELDRLTEEYFNNDETEDTEEQKALEAALALEFDLSEDERKAILERLSESDIALLEKTGGLTDENLKFASENLKKLQRFQDDGLDQLPIDSTTHEKPVEQGETELLTRVSEPTEIDSQKIDKQGNVTTTKGWKNPNGTMSLVTETYDSLGYFRSRKTVNAAFDDGDLVASEKTETSKGVSTESVKTTKLDGNSQTVTITKDEDGNETKKAITDEKVDSNGSIEKLVRIWDKVEGSYTETSALENPDGTFSKTTTKTAANGTVTVSMQSLDSTGTKTTTDTKTDKDGNFSEKCVKTTAGGDRFETFRSAFVAKNGQKTVKNGFKNPDGTSGMEITVTDKDGALLKHETVGTRVDASGTATTTKKSKGADGVERVSNTSSGPEGNKKAVDVTKLDAAKIAVEKAKGNWLADKLAAAYAPAGVRKQKARDAKAAKEAAKASKSENKAAAKAALKAISKNPGSSSASSAAGGIASSKPLAQTAPGSSSNKEAAARASTAAKLAAAGNGSAAKAVSPDHGSASLTASAQKASAARSPTVSGSTAGSSVGPGASSGGISSGKASSPGTGSQSSPGSSSSSGAGSTGSSATPKSAASSGVASPSTASSSSPASTGGGSTSQTSGGGSTKTSGISSGSSASGSEKSASSSGSPGGTEKGSSSGSSAGSSGGGKTKNIAIAKGGGGGQGGKAVAQGGAGGSGGDDMGSAVLILGALAGLYFLAKSQGHELSLSLGDSVAADASATALINKLAKGE